LRRLTGETNPSGGTDVSGKHKLRVKRDGEGAVVKMILRHPMETGARKDPGTGELIPRHFMTELRCERNGTTVLDINWGWGISKNPYLAFRLRRAQTGDRIRVTWKDDLGQEGAIETDLK
jgi:sulfur-oxidizing protein SoxZ